mmetsp:Transcript_28529/g.55872  ORF Transcript_28529/g.55872 Transcript_28529/m.55872 type:complete len:244 (+) Transcript_28529:615-1346(+)
MILFGGRGDWGTAGSGSSIVLGVLFLSLPLSLSIHTLVNRLRVGGLRSICLSMGWAVTGVRWIGFRKRGRDKRDTWIFWAWVWGFIWLLREVGSIFVLERGCGGEKSCEGSRDGRQIPVSIFTLFFHGLGRTGFLHHSRPLACLLRPFYVDFVLRLLEGVFGMDGRGDCLYLPSRLFFKERRRHWSCRSSRRCKRICSTCWRRTECIRGRGPMAGPTSKYWARSIPCHDLNRRRSCKRVCGLD